MIWKSSEIGWMHTLALGGTVPQFYVGLGTGTLDRPSLRFNNIDFTMQWNRIFCYCMWDMRVQWVRPHESLSLLALILPGPINTIEVASMNWGGR